MLVAVLFTIVVVSAGYAALRGVGLAKGTTSFALAPASGLASLAVLASWCVVLRLPPPVAGLVVVGVGVVGLVLVVADRRVVAPAVIAIVQEHRFATAVLLLAVAGPLVLLATAFGGIQVPLSPHDGAYHTQVIHAFRNGEQWSDWYPKGLAALFGAFLQVVPWLDSAQGAAELGLSLPLIGVLAVFGLGLSVWRSLVVASLGALMLSLTYLYPYFPQIWSGWPLAAGLVLVMGMWSLALEYVERQTWRRALLSGVLLGAMVLVHGSELLTTGIVLLIVLVTRAAPLDWARLGRDVVLGGVVALALAAAYLPTLFGWAASGGPNVGSLGESAGVRSDPGAIPLLPLHVAFAIEALGIDFPLRLLLVVAGVVWAVRRRSGLSAVGVFGVFLALMLAFVYLASAPVVRQVFAATFPWGLHYRLLMPVAIAQALLAGAGVVGVYHLLRVATRRWAWLGNADAPWVRRGHRLGRLWLATWFLLATWAMVVFVERNVQAVYAYSSDDAAAMAWLRANVSPGVVVVNDGFADAGIWAPYKAGVEILTLRSPPDDGTAEQRWLVAENVLRLDAVPEAMEAACQLGLGYLYRGAAESEWDARHFPTAEDLRAEPNLEEVFNQGGASAFRVGLECA